MRITALVALAAGALVLGGCTTNWTTGPQGFGKALPQDLPDSPHTCATYCKEWVPPVYRKVPRLKQCAPGGLVDVPYEAQKVVFEEKRVKPRRVAVRKGCDRTCEESLVRRRPGGYRWVQTGGGCWRYEYCPPKYEWCNRVHTEEGIEYCVEQPPEYETVVRTVREPRRAKTYRPAQYEIEYERELHTPGHWRWVARYDDCGPCTDQCGCRETQTHVVDRSCRCAGGKRRPPLKRDAVMDGCPRCN